MNIRDLTHVDFRISNLLEFYFSQEEPELGTSLSFINIVTTDQLCNFQCSEFYLLLL